MITTKRKFIKIDTSSKIDRDKYEEILNNPLCHIIDKEAIKETRKIFDSEGKLSESMDIIYYLIHYDESDI
jgi:hypothetical protein